MEANCSVNSSDGIEDDALTRPDSSRLSLGSSPSELTDEDDANPGLPIPDDDFPLDDGDGSLTPTDKIIMDDEDAPQEFDDDGLFEDSSDTLSNAPMDIDEREDEEEPFSSLSSIQAPLSPEPQQEDLAEEEEDEEEEEEEGERETNGVNEHVESSTLNAKENEKPVSKKRRGSVAMVQEEWQQRRTSKLLENKEAMAGLANAVENAEETGQSSDCPPLKSETVKDEKEQLSVADKSETEAQEDESRKEELEKEHNDEEDQPQHNCQEEERTVARTEGDDQEYQRWHKEALDALTKIEVEFARLRDKMYQEKMSELNEEALMIASGTHPELVTMMETIEKKKNKRIQTAEAWRKYKRISYQQQFQGLEYQANIDFVSGKNALRRDLLGSLNRKRWDLDSERDKLNEPLSDADRVPDPNMLLQRKRTQADESRDLHRITQSLGFPIAPRTTGIAPKSIEEDLIALGIIEAPTSSNQDKNAGKSNTTPVAQNPSAAARLPPKKVLDTSLSTNTYQSAHIYTFQGQLHYHGRIYRKGDQFTVVDASAGRYSAKLLTANDTEVHIQRTDGSKTKLPIFQLSTGGKYQLYAKHL